MSEHVATAHAHDHPEEVSIWPAVISIGILFAVAFAFSFQFVYKNGLYAALSLGIGVPMIVMGIIGWVREAMSSEPIAEGLAPPAMGWFIVAEALIFLSFFATYWVVRLGAMEWPPAGTVELPTVMPIVMTAVLVASSFTIHFAEGRLDAGDRSGFLRWLLLTMLLGVAFISMSAYEWNHLLHAGFTPATNIFGTAFYSITGFHGAHVIVGLGIFLAILIPALKGEVNEALVKSGSLYWHFVDIIWFFVVSQVYFWV